MKSKSALIVLCLLAACVAPPPAGPPPPPVTPMSLPIGAPGAGEEVGRVTLECRANAERLCPRDSVSCNAYRRGYFESCLVRAGVPPEYILVLTR